MATPTVGVPKSRSDRGERPMRHLLQALPLTLILLGGLLLQAGLGLT